MRFSVLAILVTLLTQVGVALATAPVPVPAGDVSVEFEDRSIWLYHALHDQGVSASGHANARLADLASLTIGVATWGRTTSPASGPNAAATHWFNPMAPGAYVGTAVARTASGHSAQDAGVISIEIVPFLTSNVDGFPALETIDDPPLATSYVIQTIVRPDGSVKAYRVSAGGQTQMDTLASVAPAASDSDVRIQFARGLSTAELRVNGTIAWSGPVRQSESAWWHVVPLGELGATGPFV